MTDNARDKSGFRHSQGVPIHKKNSQTCGSNYTIPFLTNLSKIFLCILFKKTVTKKNAQKPTLQKNSNTEQVVFTQMRNCDSIYTYNGRKHRQGIGNLFTAPL